MIRLINGRTVVVGVWFVFFYCGQFICISFWNNHRIVSLSSFALLNFFFKYQLVDFDIVFSGATELILFFFWKGLKWMNNQKPSKKCHSTTKWISSEVKLNNIISFLFVCFFRFCHVEQNRIKIERAFFCIFIWKIPS